MAYHRSTRLVARRGYSGADTGLGGFLDDVKSAVGKVVNFYGQTQKDAGVAALAQQQAMAQAQAQLAQQQAMYQQQPGFLSTTTGKLALVGAAGLGLVLLLRR